MEIPLRKKWPFSEFFRSVFSRIRAEYVMYSVCLRVQYECGEIRTRKTPNTDTFHAVYISGEVHLKRSNRLNTYNLTNERALLQRFFTEVLRSFLTNSIKKNYLAASSTTSNLTKDNFFFTCLFSRIVFKIFGKYSFPISSVSSNLCSCIFWKK